MDLSLIVGLIVGFGALGMGLIMEGGELGGIIGIPAFIIVVPGSLGVAIVGSGIGGVVRIPKLFALTLRPVGMDPGELMGQLVSLAEKARREGLLSLEEESEALEEEFLKKGLGLVIDGTDPEQVRAILEIDLLVMEERHELGIKMLKGLGGYAPTLGIMGTVLGMISVLAELGGSIEELGASVALAFIATLYGVSTANLVWLPTGDNLELKSKEEVHVKNMIIEGILSIQAGDNPRIVEEKLLGFLSPSERESRSAEAAA
jgi:chemotaxis protein MotA